MVASMRTRTRTKPAFPAPRRRRRAGVLSSMGFVWAGAVAIALAVWIGHQEQAQQTRPDIVALAVPSAAAGIAKPARPMPVCGSALRVNCVVDGDTLWIDREKVRIAAIDAPETAGRCASETALAARATRRLAELVSARELTLARNGVDRYGRTLATVHTAEGDVGDILVSEGLARRWEGRRTGWCGT